MSGKYPSSNYGSGFNRGVTIRGVPVLNLHAHNPAWVDSNGPQSGSGEFGRPFTTVQKAILKASPGDIIIIKDGHTESIADAVSLTPNVAGVSIVGLGNGSRRPTFTFGAATANIPLSAADVSFENLLFKSNFADVASVFTASGTSTPTDFGLIACEFRDASSILNFLKVVTGNATANCLDGMTLEFNRVYGLGTTAATQMAIMAAAQRRQRYFGNFINYPVLNDTACLVDFGANAQLDLDMGSNRVIRPSTSTTGGHLFSGGSTSSTGLVYDNYAWALDNSAGLLAPTGTKLGFQNNFMMITGVADKSGLINPAAV